MPKRLIVIALFIVSACAASYPDRAEAATITVGTYAATTLPFFTVPIEIHGASDLVLWQFGLEFDPNDVQVYYDPIFNPDPVREGPFTSSGGAKLSLFVPGFIFNGLGLLDGVAGGYLDLPPGPSGDGVLAYVDFIVIGTGRSPIAVVGASVTEGSSAAVPEPGTLLLVAGGLAAALKRRPGRRYS